MQLQAAMIATNLLGIAAGVLTGTYFVRDKDVVSGLISNIIKDSTNIIFASREMLSSIDTTGKINWESVLDKDKTSKSNIIIRDDDIILINLGYAYFNNRVIDYGTPYMSVFNKKTGAQKYLSIVGEKKEAINSYDISDDKTKVLFYFDNKISEYSFADGSLINSRPFNSKEYGAPRFYIDKNMYLPVENGGLKSINEKYPGKKIIFTTSDKIQVLDNDFNVTETIDRKDVHILIFEKGPFTFIRNDGKTKIYNNDLQPVGELDISSDAEVVGNFIYDTKDNKIIKINFDSFQN